jgi:hypothetical protein
MKKIWFLIAGTFFFLSISFLFAQENPLNKDKIQGRILNNCTESIADGNLDKRPKLLNQGEIARAMFQTPLYKICDDAGICGSSYYKFLIGENGDYLCHIVVKEGFSFYTVIFNDLIPLMKFSPGNRLGKTTKGWTDLIKFQVPCGID